MALQVFVFLAGGQPAPGISQRLVAGVQVPSTVQGFPRAVSKYCTGLVPPGLSHFSLANMLKEESIFKYPLFLLNGISWRATAGSLCVSFLCSPFFCFMRFSLGAVLRVEIVSGSWVLIVLGLY